MDVISNEVIVIILEDLAEKEFRKKNIKVNPKKGESPCTFRTKEDILREIHEFFIKTKSSKNKREDSSKEEIKKAIKTKKEEITTAKKIIIKVASRPYFLRNDYFQPPVNELPTLNYEKLFSYVGSGVKKQEAANYFEQQAKRIHVNEITIESKEAYTLIKETAWARTMGVNLGYDVLKNDGTFAYWKLFNDALNKVMYSWSFGVNL